MARLGYGATFGFFIGLVTIALATAFVYKSLERVMVLRPEPPAEFLGSKGTWTPKQRQSEDSLGRAYWENARTLSRTTFHFSDRLPENPPPEFSVDAKAHPSMVESASAARARYWQNLREVWSNPAVWKTTYKWHTGWVTGSSY